MALLNRKAAPAAPSPITIPSLSDASSAYASLQARRVELQSSKSKLDREADGIRASLRDFRPDGGRAGRVAALLEDAGPETAAGPDRLGEIAVAVKDLDAAITEVDRRLAKERVAASKVICELVRAAYAAVVRELAETLIAAHRASNALESITADLNDRNVSWTGHLAPMTARRILGDRRDDQSDLARWLSEAVARDFIPRSALPEELR